MAWACIYLFPLHVGSMICVSLCQGCACFEALHPQSCMCGAEQRTTGLAGIAHLEWMHPGQLSLDLLQVLMAAARRCCSLRRGGWCPTGPLLTLQQRMPVSAWQP